MGENFGRYSVVGQLGKGAMGVVYLANDPALNRQVAVKTVDLAVEEAEEREQLRNRLFRDARAAAVLKHPNIVAIYDVFEDAGRAYVVMEYIEGESLAARLKREPMPDVATMMRILRQMADALDYTHSRGVIHRDIKPANVMIDSTGTAKIMDFGIARISDTRTCTPTGLVVGTVEYMAPEQVLGETLDGRADQFALAVVAYQMMTGGTLFGRHTVATLAYKLVNEAPALPCTRNSALPAGVDAVVAKGLAKKAGDRFGTCTEFVDALGRAFAGGPATVSPVTAPVGQPAAPAIPQSSAVTAPVALPAAVPAQKSSRGPVVAAAVVVVVLAGALAAVVLTRNRPKEAPAASASASNPPASSTPAPPAESTAPAAQTPAPQSTPAQNPASSAPPAKSPAESAPVAASRPPAPVPDAKADVPPVAPPTKTPAANPPAASEPAVAEPVSEELPAAAPEPRMKAGPAGFQRAMERGQQQFSSKDFAGALRSFGDAIALNPGSAQAHFDRGMTFERVEQYDAAMRDFADAVRSAPAMVQAHTQLGACLTHFHRDQEALTEYNRALQLTQRAPMAFFGRGNIYLRHKQFAAALADYNRALELNPRLAPAYQNRALARQAMGDAAGAAQDRQTSQSLRR